MLYFPQQTRKICSTQHAKEALENHCSLENNHNNNEFHTNLTINCFDVIELCLIEKIN